MSGIDFVFAIITWLTIRSMGVEILVADRNNHRIQKCDTSSPDTDCITLVGTGTAGTSATELNRPYGVIGIEGNSFMLIADRMNLRLQKCSMVSAGEDCTTVVTGVNALKGSMVLDAENADIFWVGAQFFVKKCSFGGGTCEEWLGEKDDEDMHDVGSANGITFHSDGDLLVADEFNSRLLKCPLATKQPDCIWLAGYDAYGTSDGQGSGDNELNCCSGITVDSDGDYLIADTCNNRVQKCPSETPGGKCTTVAGTDGSGNSPKQLKRPVAVAFDVDGDYLICDQDECIWNGRQ